MKTMFSMGFASQDFFGVERSPVLGQATSTTDGSAILRSLSQAEDKTAAINQWMANRPQWQTIMGANLPRWNAAQSQIDSTANSAINVQQRLSSSDSSMWTLKSWELEDVNNYAAAINEQYSLINSHPQLTPGGPAAPTAPGAKPGAPTAAAPSTGVSPLVIGVGAVAAVGLLALALK